jgi:hypothetical protein
MAALLRVLSIGAVATHDGDGAPHDPPQDPEIATGDKRVLIARVDFPGATSSDTAWLEDSTVESWLGGSSDPSTQVNAYFKKASFGRLLLDKQTILPGVIRLPEAITSYTKSSELYEGLRSSLCELDTCSPHDPSSFDLIMIFWEIPADHFGYATEGYSGTPVDISAVKDGEHIQDHKNTEPMVLSINGMGMRECSPQPATQCMFGPIVHGLLRCLGAHYNADAWVPGDVDHVYPRQGTVAHPDGTVPTEAPADLTSWWEQCTAADLSEHVYGCAMTQGDPYDPLGSPPHTGGLFTVPQAEPQAMVKWHYGWIRTEDLHIAEHWGHAITGYGERVRLFAHDFGEDSLAAVTTDSCPKKAGRLSKGCPKLALVAESDTRRTDVSYSSVGKDWLWIEYKANYRNVFESDKATYSESEQQLLRERGAILHLASGPGVGHANGYGTDIITPLLLDADPSTTHGTMEYSPKGLADAPLQVGRSVRIKGHGLVVTLLGRSCDEQPPWLEVAVHRSSNCWSCWVEEDELDDNEAPTIIGIGLVGVRGDDGAQHSHPVELSSAIAVCAGQVAELMCDAEDDITPNDLLGYEWDMGDGQGLWNSESSYLREWFWNEPGTYNVTCTVWDGGAKQTTASISVVVSGEATDSSCAPYSRTESPGKTEFCREPPTPAPTPTPTFRPCRAFCESSDEPWESKCTWSTCVGCTSCASHTNSDSATTTSTTTADVMLQTSGHINGKGVFFIVLLSALARV